jgi:hypothetical protein
MAGRWNTHQDDCLASDAIGDELSSEDAALTLLRGFDPGWKKMRGASN